MNTRVKGSKERTEYDELKKILHAIDFSILDEKEKKELSLTLIFTALKKYLD